MWNLIFYCCNIHIKSAYECEHCGIYFAFLVLKPTRKALRSVKMWNLILYCCKLKPTSKVLMSVNIVELTLLAMQLRK